MKETEKHEDQLINYGKILEKKLAEKRLEREDKSTFKPSINVMSQRIMSHKIHVPLYEDALKRKEKEIAAVTCTFTPRLTVFNPAMFKDVEKPSKKNVAV